MLEEDGRDDASNQAEMRDVTAGLWAWRLRHPGQKPDQGWDPIVASTFLESGGKTPVLDPLAPPADASAFW